VTNKDVKIDTAYSLPLPSPPADKIFMNSTDGEKGIRHILEEEKRLWDSGQKEYARGDNIFGNFTRLAEQLNLSPEQVLMVYAVKHLDGIISWINGHESRRENVRGRINDLRVYLAILHLMVDASEPKHFWEGDNEFSTEG